MKKKVFYTIWFREDDNQDAILLDDETSIFYSKRQAFDIARRLVKRPVYNGCTILVRKITIKNDIADEKCIEWSFTEDDLNYGR